nr:sensor histidine kinase [Prevotella sp.]
YVDLMKIRLPANVEVTVKKDIRHPQMKIAPLIFISLVENAFKHGVSPTEPSFILIEVSTEDSMPLHEGDNGIILRCAISNTYHPKTDGDRSGHGIGLTQVQRRLDISYPDRYEWKRGISEDGRTYRSEIVLTT